jgi:hypothetical protein
MTVGEAIDALKIPSAARLDRRVPKKLLLEHGAPTAADKRRIKEGIEPIQWVAALKPSTIGVPAYKDQEREYLEIAVLHVILRPTVKVRRLVELLHRAVPYPVVGLTEQDGRLELSLAHKRWSQGEAEKTVLDDELVAVSWPSDAEPHGPLFSEALSLNRQPQGSLRTVYQGWIDALLALQAARRTGRLEIPADAERRMARGEALRECARLDAEIVRLRTAAKKEKQMPRQVVLNLELKQVEAARAAALEQL